MQASGDTVCYGNNNVHMKIVPSVTPQVVSSQEDQQNKKKKDKQYPNDKASTHQCIKL